MRFGLSVPNYGAAVTPERLVEWGRGGERLGFDLAMVTDHLAQPPEVRLAYPETFYECFAALTCLASTTTSIEIGTSVCVLPLRHVLHTARAIATIDMLSGGRVVFGIGVGGSEQEYRSLGVDFRRRGAITDEYLDCLRMLWGGGRVSFAGRFVSFEDVLATPTPRQEGGPEVWVGGSAKSAVPRAIRQRGTWHPVFPTLDTVDAGLRLAADLAEAAGAPIPHVAPRIRLSITPRAVLDPARPLGVGSIEQVTTDLHDLDARGIATVVFDPVHHPFFPDAPLSRTSAQDLREWAAIEQLAAEIVDTATHSIRG